MNKKITIEYFNDIVLPGKYHNATKMARINMVNAFAMNENIEQVNFHFVTNNKNYSTDQAVFSNKKVLFKQIFIPGIEDQSFIKEERGLMCKINKWYRIFVANRMITLAIFIKMMMVSRRENTLIFIRGPKVLKAAYFINLFRKFEYCMELHNYEFGKAGFGDRWRSSALNQAKYVITITEHTKKNWVKHGIEEKKIMVLPSGVNLDSFDKIKDDKILLRKQLGLPENKKIVTYLGGLFKHRGLEDVVAAARKNPQVLFLVIGGTEAEVEFFKKHAMQKNDVNNLNFVGFVEHSMAPKYLKSSDILLAPYSKKVSTAEHMSPLKIYEYLAAKVPVIASNLPRIKEMAPEKAITFFEADDAESLADKIDSVFANYDLYSKKAIDAYEIAAKNSWKTGSIKISLNGEH